MKNLLEVEVGHWLQFQALEVKAERIVKLIKSMEMVTTVGEIEL